MHIRFEEIATFLTENSRLVKSDGGHWLSWRLSWHNWRCSSTNSRCWFLRFFSWIVQWNFCSGVDVVFKCLDSLETNHVTLRVLSPF